MFRYDPVDIAHGLLGSLQTKARLTSEQMLKISMEMNTNAQKLRPGLSRQFALEVEWLEGAETVAKKEGESTEVDLEHISFTLGMRRVQHDSNWRFICSFHP